MSSTKPSDQVLDLFGSQARRYDERHYGSGHRTYIGDRQRMIAEIFRGLALRPGALVLDVACGPGRFLQDAAATGARVLGLDRSADMLRASRERLGPGAALVRGDGMSLPVRDASIDLVN